jgi:arylsulfatase B
MPTLLDLCGIAPGEHTFDGTSLAPLLRDDPVAWPDRVMVTDSQRIATPIKWRQSATMTRRWRLINGKELYDILVDPEQRHDLAVECPEVVAQLREGYEAWWDKVSQQFDNTIPITVGRAAGETVLLTTHDWRNDPVVCAWNQSSIRAGLVCNGHWEVDVAQSGRYRFELRRWPREEALAIAAGIAGPLKPFTSAIKDGWGGGRAMPLTAARIRVGGQVLHVPIEVEAEAAVFELDLVAGETRLQTTLCSDEGTEVGAYYVYVELL